RSHASTRVKDSRFEADAVPVKSEGEAREETLRIAEAHPRATHCCYAYRVDASSVAVERSDDAGEPAGTAGAPILSVIRGRGLGHLLVVVVRYFGGTKLGRGGLIRAYRDAARAAVDAGAVEARPDMIQAAAVIPLDRAGEARALLARVGGTLLAERYGEAAEIAFSVAADREAEFRQRLEDLARGRVRWENR